MWMEAAPHRVPHWTPSNLVPFGLESLSLHHLVVTQHLLLGAAKQILAHVCKALSDSHGSFRPCMSEVEALLGNDWRPPLHVRIPGFSPQQFEFEARHLRDLTTKRYVTDCAQIVVYYWWAAQTLSVWIGTQWAWCGLSATLCGMPHVPVHNAKAVGWNVCRAANTSTLSLTQCVTGHTLLGQNEEVLAVVDLIAEREGVEPQQRKKWSNILDAFGALAFAITPLHPTFIKQIDGVSRHVACLLTLHCALSWCVVKGILQVPQDRLWLLREMAEATLYFSRSKLASTPRIPSIHWEVARMYPEPKLVDPVDTCFSCDGTPHIACHECKVLRCALHAPILCQTEICVGLRQLWTANLAAVVAASAAHTRPSALAVVAASAVNTRRGVWICRKWYVVPISPR